MVSSSEGVGFLSTGVSTIGQRYAVPTLLTEVAPQEGLLQAFDSLSTLDSVIADVFARISSRIAQEKTKIAAVVDRVGRAQAKVAEIGANSGRVTTIFSTAKYPAPRVLNDFKRVIVTDSSAVQLPPENNGLFMPIQRTPHRIAAKDRFAPAPPADTSALFASLTGARLMRTEHAAPDEETEMAEGLGRLPAYLPSISSVLLFNSDENPYKQYVTINNLEGVGGQDRATESGGPSAAPRSIMDGLELPTYAGFTFEYKPLFQQGEMPQFDLPQNLPLGKLADITFGVDTSMSIAPSLATLALPSLDLPALPMPSRPQQVSAVPTTTPGSATATATIPSAPSAPPAPAIVTSSSAPPPPNAPPPPPMVPPAPTGVPAAVAKPTGGRGALLDAIRGGKKLKKASGPPGAGRPTGGKIGLKIVKSTANAGGETTAGEEAEAPKKAPAADSGDMMEALRNRLAMRANAISSGKLTTDGAAKPAMVPPSRRDSFQVPRLGAPSPASLLRGGKPAASAGGGPKSVAEGGDEKEEESTGTMSKAVMSAYVAAHAKKQDKDDEWE